MIRVVLPSHLRMHANIDGEVRLAVEGPVTQRSVIDALETRVAKLEKEVAALKKSARGTSGSKGESSGD